MREVETAQKQQSEFRASIVTERPGRETTDDLIANSAKLFSQPRASRHARRTGDVKEKKECQPQP